MKPFVVFLSLGLLPTPALAQSLATGLGASPDAGERPSLRYVTGSAATDTGDTALDAANAGGPAVVDPDPAQRPYDGLSLSAGMSLASGHFGAARNTTLISAPVGIRYVVGGLRLSLVVPYMRIKSDGTVFTGIDGSPLIVAPSFPKPRRVSEGVGDPTLGLSYFVPATASIGVDLDLSLRVKVPLAATSTMVSTGKTDVAVGVQASRVIGIATPFVSITYRMFGDSGPWRLRNGLASSVGVSAPVWKAVVLIGSYNYAQSASVFVANSHELFFGVSSPIAHTALRLTAFATAGLSSGAADTATGLSVALKL